MNLHGFGLRTISVESGISLERKASLSRLAHFVWLLDFQRLKAIHAQRVPSGAERAARLYAVLRRWGV
jgi:hypothetical protein